MKPELDAHVLSNQSSKIQGKSILVQVSRRFELLEVNYNIEEQINNSYTSLFYI